eukprot:744333-Prymnesium_polylepis.1
MDAAPLCKRLASALEHELLSAAEHRISLNLHGDAGPAYRTEAARKQSAAQRPAAVDCGQVALRERSYLPGVQFSQQEVEPLISALVTP